MKLSFIAAFAAILIFSSCDKDSGSDFQPGDTGSITIEFDNVVGPNDLELNTGNYTNGSGEQFTISTFDYFISNLKLKTSGGTEYVVPKDESYFLIKEEDEATHEIELENVPAGDYVSFTFTVGVDSLKSASPVSERTGVLDPAGDAAGMYWTWNSGYIFLKMEGTSPVSTTTDKKIFYHVGGFGGYDSPTLNNIKTVTINAPFESSAKVRKGAETHPQVHVFADAGKVLDGTTHISIAENSMVHFSDVSADIANNYANMFSIDHIHND
ncbi:MAG: hypothetical protein JNK79_14815 [Chitinophagaceae bacterium]|nr:hypothetical protein [Chitinophagaceae bacterium]